MHDYRCKNVPTRAVGKSRVAVGHSLCKVNAFMMLGHGWAWARAICMLDDVISMYDDSSPFERRFCTVYIRLTVDTRIDGLFKPEMTESCYYG